MLKSLQIALLLDLAVYVFSTCKKPTIFDESGSRGIALLHDIDSFDGMPGWLSLEPTIIQISPNPRTINKKC